MAEKNDPIIRVTVDDLAAVETVATEAHPTSQPAAQQAGRSYGNINATAAEAEPVRSEDKPNILLQGWFYLGAAGLVGAIAGWGICEPAFIDGVRHSWADTWILPIVTMMMLTFFAIAESVVERSLKKAVKRLLMVVPLGILF